MKNISIETAIEEIMRDIAEAGPRHGCDPDVIARVYSVLCADCEEPVCVVTGDKTASQVYVEGRPAGDERQASSGVDHEYTRDSAMDAVLGVVRDWDDSDLAAFLAECHLGEVVQVGGEVRRMDAQTGKVEVVA